MRRGRVGTAVVGAVMTMALTACGTPPWETMGTSTTDPSRSPSATPTASAPPTPVPNDLSAGSTAKSLSAGALTVDLDYYSTLTMDQWTAAAVKPLAVSMSTTVVPDDGHKVYLRQATMLAIPRTDDETLSPLEPQVDSATVSPGYLVLSPYSYAQTFNVGQLPADTVAVTLQLTYDFLVQSTPTSDEYAKQTVTDSITVAIADAPR